MKTLFKLTIVSLLSSGITFLLFISYHNRAEKENFIQNKSTKVTPIKYTSSTLSSAAPTDFVYAANSSIDAVVHVKNRSKGSSSSYLDYFFGESDSFRVGTGSGVIVTPDGYLLTNNHVIDNAKTIEVTTNDNKRYEAKLVATDTAMDIAVLKVDAEEPLPYLSFGDSDQVKIGEWVLAIGNPFNLNSTVTAGIVSAKSRDLNERDGKNQSYIQTDAAVNMGNSGGALVNTKGELIGINTAISSISGSFEGYSFAVPSNLVRKIFIDLVEYGSVQKGLLGIFGREITPDLISSEGLEILEGVYIIELQEGMGASKSGLKEGDIITQIDDRKIKTFSDLTGYIGSKRPGDIVSVEYYREGIAKTSEITLSKLKQARFLQMSLENLSEEEKEQLKLNKGLKIVDSGDYFYNIEPNSILLEINDTSLYSINDLDQFRQNDIRSLEYINPEGEKERISIRRR